MLRRFRDAAGVLRTGDDQGFSESDLRFEIGTHPGSRRRGIFGFATVDGAPCELFAPITASEEAATRRRITAHFQLAIARNHPVPDPVKS